MFPLKILSVTRMPETSFARRYYVFVAVLTAQLGIFLSGVYYSWSSPILIKLSNLEDNPLGRTVTSTEQAWIMTIGSFGVWIGACLSGEISKKFGRRPVMIFMTLPLLASYLMLAFAEHIWLILLARILGGLTNGALFAIIPLYSGEVADPKNRGILGGTINLFLNIGLLFSLAIGPFTSYKSFNMILTFCVVIYVVLITLIIPESPYFLVKKDLDKAEEALKNLRGVEDVKQELNQIQQYSELEGTEKGSLSEIINNKAARKSLIIGIGIACFQQTSGFTIIMGFGQTIFEEVHGFLPSHLSLIMLGLSQVIFGLIAPIFTDKFKRKTLLIASYSGLSICLMLFGIYFLLKLHGFSVDAISWLPLASIILFMFFFTIGSGSVTFILLGEIFSSRLKETATSMLNILASITGLALAYCYATFKDLIGTGFTFWLLASVNIIAAIFSGVCLVETKGKSLKEIQELLSKSDNSKEKVIGIRLEKHESEEQKTEIKV